MLFDIAWYTILIAFFLDWKLADPDVPWHPVCIMGMAIERAESFFRHLTGSLFRSGLIFAVVLVAGAWAGAALLIWLAGSVTPLLAHLIAIVLLYFCISARGLEIAALTIYRHLAEGNLPRARESLSLIVGREVDNLNEAGVVRASVETVAENLVDGVLAPIFFALIGGVPLAVAYKMVNTLDSMVGYKNDRYLLFGRAAARLDDAANYIPARLSVLFIPLAASFLFWSGFRSLLTGVREGRQHSSPNAGYPEASFAGALSLWLGGPNHYHGRLVDKPRIGLGLDEAGPAHIPAACRLMLLSSVLFCLTAVATAFIFR